MIFVCIYLKYINIALVLIKTKNNISKNIMRKLSFLLSILIVMTSVSCSSVNSDKQESKDMSKNSELIESLTSTEETKQEAVITMSCLETVPKQLQDTIDRFNSENNGYSIILKDYSQYMEEIPANYAGDDLEEKQNEAKKNFRKETVNDILNNNSSDIICTSLDTEVFESLKNSGFFVDLYEFFDKDEQADISQYNSNIIKLCETDGKLYEFPDSYLIYTLVGAKEYIGERNSWTIDDVIDCYNSLPENVSLTEENTTYDICNYFVYNNSGAYVENLYGDKNFHANELRKVLNFCVNFSGTKRDITEDEPYLLQMLYINRFDDFHSHIQKFEEVNGESTLIGFPSDSGYSANIYIFESFGISNNSSDEVKAGAWEFLKYAVSEEQQMNLEIGLPVNNEAFGSMAEKNDLTQREYTELLECADNVKRRQGHDDYELREIFVYDLSDLINYRSISVDQAIENINKKIQDF